MIAYKICRLDKEANRRGGRVDILLNPINLGVRCEMATGRDTMLAGEKKGER